jgi:hypothetical protein
LRVERHAWGSVYLSKILEKILNSKALDRTVTKANEKPRSSAAGNGVRQQN